MIHYIIPHTPDQRALDKAKIALNKGDIICFPSDTNWLLICDPFNSDSANKLHRLKGNASSKHYALLCQSISMASELAKIDNNAFLFLKKYTPGHFTFILEASKITVKAIKASHSSHEVGLRFVPNEFVQKFLDFYQRPLMSTNITHEMLDIEEDALIYSYMIEDKLSHIVSEILDPGEIEFAGPSTIVDLTGWPPVIQRQGSGTIR